MMFLKQDKKHFVLARAKMFLEYCFVMWLNDKTISLTSNERSGTSETLLGNRNRQIYHYNIFEKAQNHFCLMRARKIFGHALFCFVAKQ